MALGYLERKKSVKGKERLEGTLTSGSAAAAQAVTWVSKDNFRHNTQASSLTRGGGTRECPTCCYYSVF